MALNGSGSRLLTILISLCSFLGGTTVTLLWRGDASAVKVDLQREMTLQDERYYRTLTEINARLARLEDRR